MIFITRLIVIVIKNYQPVVCLRFSHPTYDGTPVQWNPISEPCNEYLSIEGDNYKLKRNYLLDTQDLWSKQWRNKLFI